MKIKFKDTLKIEPDKYILALDIPSAKLKKGTIISDSVRHSLRYQGLALVPTYENKMSSYNILDQSISKKTFSSIQKTWDKLRQNEKIDKELLSDSTNELVEDVMKKFGDINYIPLVKLNSFDQYTYAHTLNVGLITLLMAVEMGFGKKDLYELTYAGLLHDIGKSRIDEKILNAPRKLTDEEYNIVKQHVVLGKLICQEQKIEGDILRGVYEHHERYDGHGYIAGKKGTEISFYGRLISVADVYDALTSKRAYKDMWNYYKVVSYILQNAGKIFDPEISSSFIKVFGVYPPGTMVKLNDSRTATVVAVRKGNELQPVVQVEDKIIDLSKEKFYIMQVIGE